MTCSVVCVLRSGGEYALEHVFRLRDGVMKWWDKEQPLPRFVCLTDLADGAIVLRLRGVEVRPLCYPEWSGWWSKMEMFSTTQRDLGDILYFDLDTMIVGPLDEIAKPRPLTLLRDFYYPERVQSGMMYLPREDRAMVHLMFMQDAQGIMKTARGDGEFLDQIFRGEVDTWQSVLGEDAVVSYKVHVRQKKGQPVPPGASVVCFHGKPRPWLTPLWTRDL